MSLVLVALQQNTSSLWAMTFALLAILVVGGLWWLLSRLDSKRRFQQQRVIAEGARIQVVWLESGIEMCVSDRYLEHQPEVSWARTLLGSAWLADFIAPYGDPHQAREVNVQTAARAGREWIDDQFTYFAGTGSRPGALARSDRKARLYEVVSIGGVALALASLIPEIARAIGVQLPTFSVLLTQSLWEIGLAAAAAAAAYSQLMAFREVSRRYSQSLELFRQGKADFAALLNRSDSGGALLACQEVVVGVGLEALQETSSWFAMSYDRSVRPV